MAARVDAKLLELQAAVGDLRTAASSAGPTAGVQQPPGPLSSQEIEEIKRKLAHMNRSPHTFWIQRC